jgi:hypothetical protein
MAFCLYVYVNVKKNTSAGYAALQHKRMAGCQVVIKLQVGDRVGDRVGVLRD